ncbi:hypothetical protein E2986_11432 [Frieseomelitta varia]|uniref:Uncharacterized protein n=1 Tax=Frieseomelitta varia TaxID=561572 RepID=A0A833S3B8_9HYME|nr:hypothetical protein E2986_11432 [Frieseomelitta varia]
MCCIFIANKAFIGCLNDAVLVSPLLAGLAVGIGVPILLFYVYGVVPVSLCRSGGCGVSTNGTGVRFDFDDENELMGSLSVRNGGDAASIDVASHRGGNPSIGEASLSLGSGSHLEKLGRENDRESASNVAVAGTSLAGSIASSVLPGGQRLEVQADVTSTQRFSLCSETASAATSLSEKSVNASIALDDGAASTRALAGSVLNFKMDGSSISGGRSTEGEQGTSSVAGGHMDSAGQATSLSSLEEVAPGLAKRARRKPTLDRQCSDSSNWTVCGEDESSERVRFDDHVSFIEADQEGIVSTCGVNSRTSGRRKRNKETEDVNTQKSTKSSNTESKADSTDDNVSWERVNVATLRNVFFHNSTASTDREKRLSVIEEPFPVVVQNNGACFFTPSDKKCNINNVEEDLCS